MTVDTLLAIQSMLEWALSTESCADAMNGDEIKDLIEDVKTEIKEMAEEE